MRAILLGMEEPIPSAEELLKYDIIVVSHQRLAAEQSLNFVSKYASTIYGIADGGAFPDAVPPEEAMRKPVVYVR